MSKKLTEQLREVAIYGPCPCPIADVAADLIEELERDLLNLVCRIHRDGGHYIAKYGEAKAIADADTVAAQNNADLDALQADRDEWKARAEFSYKQRDELEREIERKMSAAAFVLKERDALIADNARLREALLTCSVGDFSTGHVMYPSFDEKLVEEALAASEPKITKPT